MDIEDSPCQPAGSKEVVAQDFERVSDESVEASGEEEQEKEARGSAETEADSSGIKPEPAQSDTTCLGSRLFSGTGHCSEGGLLESW